MHTLRQLREEMGFKNQADFARALGKSMQTIQAYERGARIPVAVRNEIEAMARARGVVPQFSRAQETEQNRERLTTAGTQEQSRDTITGFPRPVPEVIPVSIEAKLDEILALLKQLIGEKKVVIIQKEKRGRKT